MTTPWMPRPSSSVGVETRIEFDKSRAGTIEITARAARGRCPVAAAINNYSAHLGHPDRAH